MSTKRANVDVRAEIEALGRLTVGQLRDRPASCSARARTRRTAAT